jgi:hypothetical protein
MSSKLSEVFFGKNYDLIMKCNIEKRISIINSMKHMICFILKNNSSISIVLRKENIEYKHSIGHINAVNKEKSDSWF